MFEKIDKRRTLKHYSAYTLAEMLIVMSIIMLVILALPPATKKVFKLEEARKNHGRYECYWQGDKLMAYMAEENGRATTSEYTPSGSSSDAKCVFLPPKNAIYIMILAVGGGGAGAQIDTATSTSASVKTSIGYLYKTAKDLYPDWVKYVDSMSSRPWNTKSGFDTYMTATHETLHYRLGGTAGKVSSFFIPSLSSSVQLEIKPGRGGGLNATGSGGDGGDTTIQFVYKSTGGGADTVEQALVAKGGIGGDGNIKGERSVMRLGQKTGDAGLSNYSSIAGKASGFLDLIESDEDDDVFRTRVPSDAGAGGNGETGFLSTTDGDVLYEWDDYLKVKDGRRIGSVWKTITENVGLNVYRNQGLESNCSQNDVPSTGIEVQRRGFCSTYDFANFDCLIGKVKEGSSGTYECDSTGPCSKFLVRYNSSNPNNTTINIYNSDGNIGSESNTYTYSSSRPFYNCTFNYGTFEIICKTKVTSGKKHHCTNGLDDPVNPPKCSNGDTPVGSKCKARAGGDGAVVILW